MLPPPAARPCAEEQLDLLKPSFIITVSPLFPPSPAGAGGERRTAAR